MEVIKNIIKYDFWIGKEVEGRLKGVKTLFIVSDKNIKDIEVRAQKHNISHLYFGAGNQSIVRDFDTIIYLTKKGYYVTLEVLINEINTVPLAVIKNKDIHIILTIKNNIIDIIKSTDSLKFEGKKNIFISVKECMYKNDFNCYKNDMEVKI